MHRLLSKRAIAASVCCLLATTGHAQSLLSTDARAPETHATAGSTRAPRFAYHFGLDYSVTFSSRHNYPYPDDSVRAGETFAWERLRPSLVVKSNHLDVVLEGQDVHAAGSVFSNRKGWLDVLNAYAQIKNLNGWGFKVGRYEGDWDILNRVVGTSNYSAIIKSFDIGEVSWQNKRVDLRGFVSSPVDNLPSKFNTRRKGEVFGGTHARVNVGVHVLQGYLVSRRYGPGTLTSEAGTTGNGVVHAFGVNDTGPLPIDHLSWYLETIFERGRWSTDSVRAYGVFFRTDYRLPKGHSVSLGFNTGSGDRAKGDGERGTFDTLYGGSSGTYGGVGISKGSNLRALVVRGIVKFSGPVNLDWRVFNNHLAHYRTDFWYGNFTPNIYEQDATSSHVGTELNLTLNVEVSRRTLVQAGYFKLFPGQYLANRPGISPSEFRLQLLGLF